MIKQLSTHFRGRSDEVKCTLSGIKEMRIRPGHGNLPYFKTNRINREIYTVGLMHLRVGPGHGKSTLCFEYGLHSSARMSSVLNQHIERELYRKY